VAKPFLFTLNTQDQLDLFEAAATATGLPHFVLEKDYYVTLTLKLLFERLKPYHTERTSTPFMFKGGTTLSKVYGCIDRMSEDIDLSLDMNFLGYPEPANHEGTTATSKRVALLNEATQAAVSDVIAPFLRDELLEINSSFGVSVLKNGMDIEVQYPQIFEAPGGGYINPRVLLECGGKAGLEPSARHEIQPMVLDNVADHGDSCLVDVLGCDRTFFEKLTALHEINHRGVEKLDERQSRHIYDVISIHDKFPGFIEDRELLAKVVRHKKKYFRRGAAQWDKATPGSLRLMPEGELARFLEDDWEKMDVMFPGSLPWSFGEMLEKLATIDERINNLNAEE